MIVFVLITINSTIASIRNKILTPDLVILKYCVWVSYLSPSSSSSSLALQLVVSFGPVFNPSPIFTTLCANLTLVSHQFLRDLHSFTGASYRWLFIWSFPKDTIITCPVHLRRLDFIHLTMFFFAYSWSYSLFCMRLHSFVLISLRGPYIFLNSSHICSLFTAH